MRPARGFTLPEVLTGLVLMALLLLAVWQLLSGSLHSYRLAIDMNERVHLETVARNVVIQELSFAGYGLGFIGSFDGPTIEIGLVPDEDRSDTFRVHYLEERWLETPVQRHVTIDVARDAAGSYNLYRREEGASRQPAVQEVTNLKLASVVTVDGELLGRDDDWPAEIAAFIVSISFSWDTSRMAYINFSAPQRLERL